MHQYKIKSPGSSGPLISARQMSINHFAAAAVTLTSTFDDGDGICETVATEVESWSSVRGMFR